MTEFQILEADLPLGEGAEVKDLGCLVSAFTRDKARHYHRPSPLVTKLTAFTRFDDVTFYVDQVSYGEVY